MHCQRKFSVFRTLPSRIAPMLLHLHLGMHLTVLEYSTSDEAIGSSQLQAVTSQPDHSASVLAVNVL